MGFYPYNRWILLCVFINILYVSNPFVSGKIDEHELPPSVIAASKFIKEFHRKLEDDSYPIIKSDMSDRELPTLIDNLSFHSVKTDFSEKNISSLVKCSYQSLGSLQVELVNSSRLGSLLSSEPNVSSRLSPAPCLVLLFYSPSCPFSCLAAPHFNALPRLFPGLKMAAINAIQHQAFNTQFGIAGVPTLMIFHNGKAAAKFNDTDYTLEMFAKFISRVTGLKAVEKMFVASEDFGGPVSTVLVREPDRVLWLAWLVILASLCLGVTRLDRWRLFLESVAAVWREANHDHTD